MDLFNSLQTSSGLIKCIDMHTSGEPTRVIISGYPQLIGDTLLQKRKFASEHYDFLRARLMLEPRGHAGMYGAILVLRTELVDSGEADIGVLFCHNEGYSTMCGHATIALGRFLIDTKDTNVFPQRKLLKKDETTGAFVIRLHAPCGIVKVFVQATDDGHADLTEPVSFLSVPSFAKRNVQVFIPEARRWKNLMKERVTVNVAYGGAFYALVTAAELGFPLGIDSSYTISEFDEASAVIKDILSGTSTLFTHYEHKDLEFLYGVVISDKIEQGELGLCFFADQQIDRSPTGSAVSARVALAIEQGSLEMGEWRTYESIVSLGRKNDSFQGRALNKTEHGYVVEVRGRSYYTGTSVFVAESGDNLVDGCTLQLPRA